MKPRTLTDGEITPEQQAKWEEEHKHQPRPQAPATAENLEPDQARRIAQVCFDMHERLGIKWGDDPFHRIDTLRRLAREQQPNETGEAFEHEWRSVGRMVDTADSLWKFVVANETQAEKIVETHNKSIRTLRASLISSPSQSATDTTRETKNTARIDEPIWDSRNSDEPAISPQPKSDFGGASQTKTDEQWMNKAAVQIANKGDNLAFWHGRVDFSAREIKKIIKGCFREAGATQSK